MRVLLCTIPPYIDGCRYLPKQGGNIFKLIDFTTLRHPTQGCILAEKFWIKNFFVQSVPYHNLAFLALLGRENQDVTNKQISLKYKIVQCSKLALSQLGIGRKGKSGSAEEAAISINGPLPNGQAVKVKSFTLYFFLWQFLMFFNYNVYWMVV